jgi:hypothetical protein
MPHCGNCQAGEEYITKYGLGIDTLAALSYVSFAQRKLKK